MFNLRPHAAARRKPTAENRDFHLPQRGPFNIFDFVLDNAPRHSQIRKTAFFDLSLPSAFTIFAKIRRFASRRNNHL